MNVEGHGGRFPYETEELLMPTEQRVLLGLERSQIPSYMHNGVIEYVVNHRPVGDFLTAVFQNDLAHAAQRADDQNGRVLPSYAGLLFNYVPAECWGSKDKVRAWLADCEVAQ